MDADHFIDEFAEMVGVSKIEISLETKLESLEKWDSLCVLSYMAYIDEKCGRQVNPDDIAHARTVADLYRLTLRIIT